MSRFNKFMNSHWAGCRLLAETHDHNRNRPVKIYLVPGEFNCVGITDGTDSWVAPSNCQPFAIDILRVLNEIRNGGDPRVLRLIKKPNGDTKVEHIEKEAGSPTGRRVIKHVPDFHHFPDVSETPQRIRRVINLRP